MGSPLPCRRVVDSSLEYAELGAILVRGADDSIKPGGPAPGSRAPTTIEPAKRAIEVATTATARSAGFDNFSTAFLGFRCASPQGGVPRRASRLGCETLCWRPLRPPPTAHCPPPTTAPTAHCFIHVKSNPIPFHLISLIFAVSSRMKHASPKNRYSKKQSGLIG